MRSGQVGTAKGRNVRPDDRRGDPWEAVLPQPGQVHRCRFPDLPQVDRHGGRRAAAPGIRIQQTPQDVEEFLGGDRIVGIRPLTERSTG